MSKQPKVYTEPTNEEISTYAYYLWEADGRPQGLDMDHWLQAKAQLIANRHYETDLMQAQKQPPARSVQEIPVTAKAASVSSSDPDAKLPTAAKPASKRSSVAGGNASQGSRALLV